MIFLILVSYVIAVRGDVTKEDVFIDGVRHQTETLITNANLMWLYSLAVDYSFNDLYFIDNGRPAILNLNTGERKYIEGEIDALCVTVDQETHDVYLGACDGIYKYKPSTGAVELIGADGAYVRDVNYKGVLYYTEYYSDTEFTLVNGDSEKFVNIQNDIYKLVIDNEDVIFYSNNIELYSQKINSNNATLYYNDTYVYNLAVDRNDKVYVASVDALYEVIKYNATIRKVVSIKDIRSITFDKNNNIIYCDTSNIYRLKPITEGFTMEQDVKDVITVKQVK